MLKRWLKFRVVSVVIGTGSERVSILSLTPADPVANPASGSSVVEMFVQSGSIPFDDVDPQIAPSELKSSSSSTIDQSPSAVRTLKPHSLLSPGASDPRSNVITSKFSVPPQVADASTKVLPRGSGSVITTFDCDSLLCRLLTVRR